MTECRVWWSGQGDNSHNLLKDLARVCLPALRVLALPPEVAVDHLLGLL